MLSSSRAFYAKAERGTLPGATRLGRRLYFIRAEPLADIEQGLSIACGHRASKLGVFTTPENAASVQILQLLPNMSWPAWRATAWDAA